MPLRILPLPPGLLPRILLLIPLLPGFRAASQTGDCKLIGENGAESDAERGLLKKLEPLMGQSFSMTSTESSTMETYTYSFRVCAAIDNHPLAGLIQHSKKNDTKVIGRINSTQIIGGSDWIILIYGDGDRYTSHCKGEKRRGMVMISCDPSVLGAAFTTVIEEREKVSDCFYLFELDSKTACPPPSHRLSPGSILLIMFLVLITVYILGGFLYQRLVIRAKGFEQIPNYYFWQELGNLTADGCDFVFRSKPRTAAAAYRGVGDEQLGEEDEEERDEHLLPM